MSWIAYGNASNIYLMVQSSQTTKRTAPVWRNPLLKALAIGVIIFIGVVLYALIAACVGAHKREGR